MDRQSTVEDILEWLSARRSNSNIAGMGRYGINTDRAFGVSSADLRSLARIIGKNHQRSLDLWQAGFRETRLLAAFTDEKSNVTLDQARDWSSDFNSWEIVDGVTDLFVDAGLGNVLIPEFAADEREFVRRAAFSMIAWTAVHLKKKPDNEIVQLLGLIDRYATDPRNFVKKSVSWALRSIGKRSLVCHGPALELARKLTAHPDKTAQWIGKDCAKELSDPKYIAMIGQKKTAANKARILATRVSSILFEDHVIERKLGRVFDLLHRKGRRHIADFDLGDHSLVERIIGANIRHNDFQKIVDFTNMR